MLPNRNCLNTLDDFHCFCQAKRITLNEKQEEVAKTLFSMPTASGKSLLIALLCAYDPSVGEYLLLKNIR